MKAVVLEIRDGFAAVLKEDGTIEKIKRKCKVGEVIEVTGKSRRYDRIRVLGSAAAAVVIVLAGGGTYGYRNVMACSYISLDINPSIEYVLNRKDKVIAVEALNDDAEPVVDALLAAQIHSKSLEEALELTEQVLAEQNYITEDDTDYILMNVASDSEKRTAYLTEAVTEAISVDERDIELVVTESSLEERKKAKKLGISSGRYVEMRTIESAEAGEDKEPDASTVERYRDRTVQEFMRDCGQIPARPEAGGSAPGGNNTLQGEAGEGAGRPAALPEGNNAPSGGVGPSGGNDPAGGDAPGTGENAATGKNGISSAEGNTVSPGGNEQKQGTENGSSAGNGSAREADTAAAGGSSVPPADPSSTGAEDSSGQENVSGASQGPAGTLQSGAGDSGNYTSPGEGVSGNAPVAGAGAESIPGGGNAAGGGDMTGGMNGPGNAPGMPGASSGMGGGPGM